MQMLVPSGARKLTPSLLVLALDLVGTFAFAISGATAGVRKRLDLFGVLVLAFALFSAGAFAQTSTRTYPGLSFSFQSSASSSG